MSRSSVEPAQVLNFSRAVAGPNRRVAMPYLWQRVFRKSRRSVSVLRPCNVRELLGRPTHFSSDAAAATAMQDVRHQGRYAACRSTRPRIKGATPVGLRNPRGIMLTAMTSRAPSKSFMESFKRLRSVSKPIASEIWTAKDAKGRRRTVRVEIGKPRQVPRDANGDWFCPVFIEGFTGHVIPAMGVGPVDSLMNAVTLVHSFLEHVAWLHVSPARSKARRG